MGCVGKGRAVHVLPLSPTLLLLAGDAWAGQKDILDEKLSALGLEAEDC